MPSKDNLDVVPDGPGLKHFNIIARSNSKRRYHLYVAKDLTISDSSGGEVARLDTPKTILLRGIRESIPINEWLKPTRKRHSLPIEFEHNGKKYFWNKVKDDEFELYSSDLCIASYHPAARIIGEDLKPRTQHAYISLNEEEARSMMDIVVVSLFVMKEARKMSGVHGVVSVALAAIGVSFLPW
ncbi:hypothetical protein BDZ89DRAFT_1071200 [Hymenopellis radicata]|nr:hypothetical protein BDZ89DRAFT_1071200 [Hymenopellis radicata]